MRTLRLYQHAENDEWGPIFVCRLVADIDMSVADVREWCRGTLLGRYSCYGSYGTVHVDVYSDEDGALVKLRFG